MDKKSSNKNLHKANKAKKDEFYTQLVDIEKELKHYKDQFRGKVVYCNCDDPFESNFFKYFASNFKALELKRLIATSYKPSPVANTELVLQPAILPGYEDKILSKPVETKGRPKVTANKFIINDVSDLDGDGSFDLRDVAEQLKKNKNNEWTPLEGDGDFRSSESIELLKQADIVVTNPPFSLFREYVTQLVEYKKKFLIIGNINAITYKEIFPLIKENNMWIGETMNGSNRWFEIPDSYETYHKMEGSKKYAFVPGVMWFTNLDTKNRHQELILYKKYRPEEYPHYDNYDAIDVSKVVNIPADWYGTMGVPISFVNKYNPDQFEIIKFRKGNDEKDLSIDGKCPYFRILIKNKKPQK